MALGLVEIRDIGNGVSAVLWCNSVMGVVVKSLVPSWRFAFFASAPRTWSFGMTPREAVSKWFEEVGYTVPSIIDSSRFD